MHKPEARYRNTASMLMKENIFSVASYIQGGAEKRENLK
jgi:hypothetical protein